MEEQSLSITQNPNLIVRAKSEPAFGNVDTSPDDISLINKIAPVHLEANQVYVRSMYLCSTQPCPSDGCQFTRRALDQIAALIIGQSVLAGHNRASLPIARFYKSVVEQRGKDDSGEAVFFVRAWFYWMRDTADAEDLLVNIDGGIYREVSLSWRYSSWYCSLCQSKNSECGHRTGELIDGKRCFRMIDQVTEVLEGSLVYKAADTNTTLAGIRGELSLEDEPVLMAGRSSDPLLSKLIKDGLLSDIQDVSDVEEVLRDSVRILWVRFDQEENLRLADSLLTADGACMVDESNGVTEESITRIIQRGEDNWLENSFLPEEVNHAAIRSI